MEQLGQSYGYILYRIQLPVRSPASSSSTRSRLRRRLPRRQLIGTLDRHYNQDQPQPSTTTGPARLDILVENSGRLNSTRHMRGESKGITHAISLDGTPLTGWQIYSLPIASARPDCLRPPPAPSARPALRLTAPSPSPTTGDTFLDVGALGKGVLWINGHALGRFWNIGPQHTLYVPGPWLRKGRNELIVFDMLAAEKSPTLAGLTTPILDAPTPTYDNDPERKKKPAADAEFGPKLFATRKHPLNPTLNPPKE